MVNYDELGPRIILAFADGKIQITESTLFGILVAAVLAVLGIWLGSGLKTVPKGKQVVAETIVGWIYKYTSDNMGKENEHFAPYIGTIFSFILIGSSLGLLGVRPITADLNVTAALAIMSMLLIEYSGIHRNGLKHWAGHFAKPVPFVAPIMVMEIFIRPLSLCMRLFGNMLGGFVVMELVKAVVPLLVPIPLSFYFDIFDGLLQAYVFVFLTALFMNEEME